MVIQFSLQSVIARGALILLSLAAILLLARMALNEFTVAVLSDNRLELNENFLASAVSSAPNSSRLLYALALAETSSPKSNLEQAKNHIIRAVELSPHNYNYRLLLAQISEAQGDKPGAEAGFREALRLAPHYSETHWNLGNFLIRAGKPESSIEHFSTAANLDPSLLLPAIDLVWQISGKDINALNIITRGNPQSQLPVALFFARQKRFTEAAEAFAKVERETALSSPETSVFFDTLLKNGYPVLTQKLWLQMAEPDEQDAKTSGIWNGDFESRSFTAFPQFDWQIKRSDYARIEISQLTGRSNSRSLQLDFTGRDTTILNREVTHSLALQPGAGYRLEFFVKTENFITPEGPRIVVSDNAGNRLADSGQIFPTKDWKLMSLNFTAPKKSGDGDGVICSVSIERKPRLAYDEPTKGRIWFDDFSVSEANRK